MTKWKAYTWMQTSGGGRSQQTVFVETENDQFFEAERLFKSLYSEVWNIQRVSSTINKQPKKTESKTVFLILAFLFLIWLLAH